jgi:hypothetical protein
VSRIRHDLNPLVTWHWVLIDWKSLANRSKWLHSWDAHAAEYIRRTLTSHFQSRDDAFRSQNINHEKYEQYYRLKPRYLENRRNGRLSLGAIFGWKVICTAHTCIHAYKTNCRLAYLRRGRLKAVRFYRLSGINVVGVILNKMRTLHGPIPSRKEGIMVFSFFHVNLMMTSVGSPLIPARGVVWLRQCRLSSWGELSSFSV